MLYPVSDIVTINKSNSDKMEELLGSLLSKESIPDFQNKFDYNELHDEGLDEQENFRNGTEQKVPDIVLNDAKFLIDNGIEIKVFRKLLTPNCEQAIEARKIALNDETLQTGDEVKTLVFDAKDKHHNIIKVAVHMRADHNIGGDMSNELKDFLRAECKVKYKENQEGKEVEKEFNFNKVFPSTDALHGRQDAMTFYNNYPGGIQIFHKALNEETKVYANLGSNTWGVMFEGNFKEVINALKTLGRTYDADTSLIPPVRPKAIADMKKVNVVLSEEKKTEIGTSC